jgi:uncharacterized protein (DUF2235 family)
LKRIFICADGTWNRPEEDLEKDEPTNVLRLARAVSPLDDAGVPQVVFYDWGLGSYHSGARGGGFGDGINKNIMDGYRFLVQNYDPGDEIYLIGFSRGAYTVRSLWGLIYTVGILKRRHANRIENSFKLYKSRDNHPEDAESEAYRRRYSVPGAVRIRFVGVWDTVGALGVPVHLLGFLNERHVFHDNKIGPNVDVARHALAIDERRDDFEPTIWKKRRGTDLAQVWFAGVHSDVGGGYPKMRGECLTCDIPLGWILREATDFPSDGSFQSYGSRHPEVSALAEEEPAWDELLHPNLPYRGVHVVWAARHEMARTLEDVLSRRTRALLMDARASLEVAPRAAALLAAELGRDAAWQEEQVRVYSELARGYLLPRTA